MDTEQVVKNLLGFALDQGDIKTSLNELSSINITNQSSLQYELMFLRAFAVDYSIYAALGNFAKERDLLSNKYRDLLIDFILEVSDNTGIDALDILENRFDKYFSAFNEIYPLLLKDMKYNMDDLSSRVGNIFAELCGYHNNIAISTFGSKIFESIISGAVDFIKSVK